MNARLPSLRKASGITREKAVEPIHATAGTADETRPPFWLSSFGLTGQPGLACLCLLGDLDRILLHLRNNVPDLGELSIDDALLQILVGLVDVGVDDNGVIGAGRARVLDLGRRCLEPARERCDALGAPARQPLPERGEGGRREEDEDGGEGGVVGLDELDALFPAGFGTSATGTSPAGQARQVRNKGRTCESISRMQRFP